MKFLKYFFIVTIVFILGYITSSIYNFPDKKPWIFIELDNNTSQDIIEISIETSQKVSFQHTEILKKNSSITFPLYFYGEGTYSMQVLLKDGTTLIYWNGYIEGGSTTKQWVTDKGIFDIFNKSRKK